MKREYILAINPGSTSTKLGIFKGIESVVQSKIEHSADELAGFERVFDQLEYRMKLIVEWLKDHGYSTGQFLATVGRGGLLRPIPGGTYTVSEEMVQDLKDCVGGEHAANLGGVLAKGIADLEGIRSYIVDPVAVDELEEIARISGLKDITRRSLVHALNIKAVAHKKATELSKSMEECNFIVAHLGGGISVAPMLKGRIVDINNAKEMGPFSPDRSGTLPVGDIVRMCFSGKYTLQQMITMMQKEGGLYSYLGTFNAKEVEERGETDPEARLIYDAMIYQIGKEIGACAPVLFGEVDAVILTGGLAYSKRLVERLKEMTEFIAPVTVYPGEDEMDALNRGALRVIEGEERAKEYKNEVI